MKEYEIDKRINSTANYLANKKEEVTNSEIFKSFAQTAEEGFNSIKRKANEIMDNNNLYFNINEDTIEYEKKSEIKLENLNNNNNIQNNINHDIQNPVKFNIEENESNNNSKIINQQIINENNKNINNNLNNIQNYNENNDISQNDNNSGGQNNSNNENIYKPSDNNEKIEEIALDI